MTRFFRGDPWRFVVTTLDSQVLTILDRLASQRTVTIGMDQPRVAAGQVPSDSPEINIEHTDGDPFLNEGNRILVGFRREGGALPWVCRFHGILDHVEDAAGANSPVTHYSASDPWQLMFKRPLRLSGGALPGPAGRVFVATQASQVAFQIIQDSTVYDGDLHLDIDTGLIGATDEIDITFQQGQSVGDCLNQLVATGKLHVSLNPIWDPVTRPGVCAVLNLTAEVGQVRNGAIFAWDKPSKSLVSMSQLFDGTQRENTVQYYAGQGGPPVAVAVDAASVAKYGEYWAQQFFPGMKVAGPVAAMGEQRLRLMKDGQITYQFQPAPERSPIPLVDYEPGDWCPFWASSKVRRPLGPTLVDGAWTNIPRVRAMTLQIGDTETEVVSDLIVSREDVTAAAAFGGGGGAGFGSDPGGSGSGGGTPGVYITGSAVVGDTLTGVIV